MKFLLVLATLVAIAVAQYDYPAPARRSEYGAPAPGQGPGPGPQAPQVHRHVYVHVAPDEPEDRQSKVIRVPGGGDKHVNIIFVKTPSQNSQQQTEVILPEQDEHKNLVYVLLKKGESNSNIQIRRPQAARPTKPEVYFIRYKNEEGQTGGTAYGAPSSGAPAPVIRTSQPSGQYGSPF